MHDAIREFIAAHDARLACATSCDAAEAELRYKRAVDRLRAIAAAPDAQVRVA